MNNQTITGKMARPLDPDINPWDRQPDEPEDAHDAFTRYRDTEGTRNLFPPGPRPDDTWDEEQTRAWNARRSWLKRQSAVWQWSARALAWDHWVAQQAAEDLVRYRVRMDERHRNIGRAGLQKIAQWMVNLDPDRLKPSEAIRLLEVSARLEREAAGAYLAAEVLVPAPESGERRTLSEVLSLPRLAEGEEAELADRLYRIVKRATGGRDAAD